MSWFSEWLHSVIGTPRPKPLPVPIPVPTNPPIPSDFSDNDALASMLQKVRSTPIVSSVDLVADAQAYAEHMNQTGNFQHRNPLPNYIDGEIIAWGYRTPQEVFNGWRSSPGHNAIMVSPGNTRCGFGHSGSYWVGVFK